MASTWGTADIPFPGGISSPSSSGWGEKKAGNIWDTPSWPDQVGGGYKDISPGYKNPLENSGAGSRINWKGLASMGSQFLQDYIGKDSFKGQYRPRYSYSPYGDNYKSSDMPGLQRVFENLAIYTPPPPQIIAADGPTEPSTGQRFARAGTGALQGGLQGFAMGGPIGAAIGAIGGGLAGAFG